jgi:D-glucosaminate-6-phosphate ammonia-lyase
MAGLVRAVELYLAQDHEAVSRQWEETVAKWTEALSAVPGLTAVRDFPNEAGQPIPRARVTVDHDVIGFSGEEMMARLWDRDPRVCVLHDDHDSFFITPEVLADGQSAELVAAITEVATGAAGR